MTEDQQSYEGMFEARPLFDQVLTKRLASNSAILKRVSFAETDSIETADSLAFETLMHTQ